MKSPNPLFIITLIVGSFLCGDAHCGDQELKPSTLKTYYPPVIWIGKKSATEKAIYYWTSEPESAMFFLKHVTPLYFKARKDANFALVLVQYLSNKSGSDGKYPDISGPGALLLCAGNHTQYANFVLQYLTLQGDRSLYKGGNSPLDQFMVNDPLINSAIKLRINLQNCVKSDVFYKRVAFVIGFSEEGRKENKISSLPLLDFRGNRIDINNTHLIEALGGSK